MENLTHHIKNENFNHVEVEVAVTSAFGISQISNSNYNRI